MTRRVLAILVLLALSLAVVSPAFAAGKKPDKVGPAGKPEVSTTVIRGKVTAVGSDQSSLTIAPDTGSPVTVKLDAGSGVKAPGLNGKAKGKSKGAATAGYTFVGGEYVVVKAKTVGSDLVATMVHLIPGKTFVHFGGTVESNSGGKLVIKNDKGDTKELVYTGDGPVVRVVPKKLDTGSIKASGIAQGERVTAVGRLNVDPNAAPTLTSIKVMRGSEANDDLEDEEAKG